MQDTVPDWGWEQQGCAGPDTELGAKSVEQNKLKSS